MGTYQQTNSVGTTLIHKGNSFILSTIILYNNEPIGVASLQIDTLYFMQDLIETLSIHKFKLSQNYYYLLRPAYQLEQSPQPQIISFFDSQNNNIPVTPSNSFLNTTQHQLSPELFQGKQDYKLLVKKTNQLRNCLSIPILTKNYMGTSSICMYLLLVNHFEESNLSEQYFRDIKVSLIVPVIMLFLAASIITSVIIRRHLLRLVKILGSFVNYCSLILKGDIQLEIKYDDVLEKDVRDLFQQLATLNKLNKYTEPKFYTGTKTQLISKYFQAYKFFNQKEYNLANVCENIAECYLEMGQIREACKFIRNAISIDVDQYSQYRTLERMTIYKNNLQEEEHINKMESILRKKKELQKNLMRRIHKQILFMHNISHPENIQLTKQISFLMIRLKKLVNLRGSNLETIGISLIEIKENLRNKNLGRTEENLQKIEKVIRKYERSEMHEECEIPSDILWSEWNYLYGELMRMQNKCLYAYDHYVLSLQGEHFNPSLHSNILNSLSTLLTQFRITHQLQQFEFHKQTQKRQYREYVFLIDVSNPALSSVQRKNWSKQNSDVAEYILSNYIHADDRLSINEFHTSRKIKCNLVKKQNQEKLLKNDLRSSFRSIKRQSYPQVLRCLEQAIGRVDHLQMQKYFIVFLKKHVFVDNLKLERICEESHNSVFVFITENKCLEPCTRQNCYVLDPGNIRNIDRILQEKVIRFSDNKIYVF